MAGEQVLLELATRLARLASLDHRDVRDGRDVAERDGQDRADDRHVQVAALEGEPRRHDHADGERARGRRADARALPECGRDDEQTEQHVEQRGRRGRQRRRMLTEQQVVERVRVDLDAVRPAVRLTRRRVLVVERCAELLFGVEAAAEQEDLALEPAPFVELAECFDQARRKRPECAGCVGIVARGTDHEQRHVLNRRGRESRVLVREPADVEVALRRGRLHERVEVEPARYGVEGGDEARHQTLFRGAHGEGRVAHGLVRGGHVGGGEGRGDFCEVRVRTGVGALECVAFGRTDEHDVAGTFDGLAQHLVAGAAVAHAVEHGRLRRLPELEPDVEPDRGGAERAGDVDQAGEHGARVWRLVGPSRGVLLVEQDQRDFAGFGARVDLGAVRFHATGDTDAIVAGLTFDLTEQLAEDRPAGEQPGERDGADSDADADQ